jgi:hypothetical protein
MSSITTVDFLVEAFIESKRGSAVAEQFLSTFNGYMFEKCNINALRYIREDVNKILYSELLNETAQDELQTYRDDLEDYMVGAK